MILLYISILLPICTAFRVCSAPCPSRGGRFALSISRYEIYRLRRQKEILDAMNYILERRDKLRIGRNIDPIIIESIHIVEVELNSDCSHARLKVCIAGDSFQQRQGFSWLEKNSKMLRYRLAQMLNHRKNVPTLSFHSHNLVQQAEVLVKMNERMMSKELQSNPPEESDDDEPPGDDYAKLLLV